MSMTASIHHQDPGAKAEFLRQFRDYQLERTILLDNGKSALIRLIPIAENDTGQSEVVRRFLLSLYNGSRFPFDLTRFRSLDKTLFADCIAVLSMDARACVQEIHEYIDDGGALFEHWAKMEGGS